MSGESWQIEMSDTTTPTTDAVTTPDAGAVNQAAVTEATPQPFAVFQDAKAFNQRLARETRKVMNEQAKAAGFDDWTHMQETHQHRQMRPHGFAWLYRRERN